MAKQDFMKAKAHAFAGLAAAALLATGSLFVGCNNDPDPVETKNEYPAATNFTGVPLTGFNLLSWDVDEFNREDTILRSADDGTKTVSIDANKLIKTGYTYDNDVKDGVTYTYTLSRVLENNVKSVSTQVKATVPAVGSEVDYSYAAANITATKYATANAASGDKDGVQVVLSNLNPAYSYSVSVYGKSSDFTQNDPTKSDFNPSGDATQSLLHSGNNSIIIDYMKDDATGTLFFYTGGGTKLADYVRVVVQVTLNSSLKNANSQYTLKKNTASDNASNASGYYVVQPTVN